MTGKSLPLLPAPFENTYFRERALKVAARQKQGHILISSVKPDNGRATAGALPLPFPYIHVVPGLRLGSYPYDQRSPSGLLPTMRLFGTRATSDVPGQLSIWSPLEEK